MSVNVNAYIFLKFPSDLCNLKYILYTITNFWYVDLRSLKTYYNFAPISVIKNEQEVLIN